MPTLKVRSDLHLARKIWHAAGVSGMAAGFLWMGPAWSWGVLAAVALAIVPLDFLRKVRPGLNDATIYVFRPFLREHEKHALSGLTYLLGGAAILLALFPKDVVTLTLLFLAFGDPVASFCGIRFGRDRIIGNKTLQGTAGAFVTCTVVAGLYFYAHNLMIERLWIVAPLSGLIGAAAELVPVGKMDDNLTFPAIAGFLLWLLFLLFGA
jgi:dolichol kinase